MTEDKIQAIASVSLQYEWDDKGKLHNVAREQGLAAAHVEGFHTENEALPQRVPVVYIDALVTAPNLDHAGQGAELVRSIISWAKSKGRLVEITPKNSQLEEYYYNLAFRRIDVFGFASRTRPTIGFASSPTEPEDPFEWGRANPVDLMVYRGNRKEDTPSQGLLLDFSYSGELKHFDPVPSSDYLIRAFDPKKQAGKNSLNRDAEVERLPDLSQIIQRMPEFEHPRTPVSNTVTIERPKKPVTKAKKRKVRINAAKVLAHWAERALVKERQAKKQGDINGAWKMVSDEMAINRIQKDIELKKMYHHILGWTVGEASEKNLQAVASVSLVIEWEDKGTLQGELHDVAKEQGLSVEGSKGVPVASIDVLVTDPDLTQTGGELNFIQKAELVYGIIDWAIEKRRLVVLTPENEKKADYYYSLGFRRIDVFGDTRRKHLHTEPVGWSRKNRVGRMVYRGNQHADTPGRGRLLELR